MHSPIYYVTNDVVKLSKILTNLDKDIHSFFEKYIDFDTISFAVHESYSNDVNISEKANLKENPHLFRLALMEYVEWEKDLSVENLGYSKTNITKDILLSFEKDIAKKLIAPLRILTEAHEKNERILYNPLEELEHNSPLLAIQDAVIPFGEPVYVHAFFYGGLEDDYRYKVAAYKDVGLFKLYTGLIQDKDSIPIYLLTDILGNYSW